MNKTLNILFTFCSIAIIWYFLSIAIFSLVVHYYPRKCFELDCLVDVLIGMGLLYGSRVIVPFYATYKISKYKNWSPD